MVAPCTPGYEFKDGDISGDGFGSTTEESMEKCAKRCDDTNGCNSYQYSKSAEEKNCAIHRGNETHIRGNTFKDFYMCFKRGIEFR